MRFRLIQRAMATLLLLTVSGISAAQGANFAPTEKASEPMALASMNEAAFIFYLGLYSRGSTGDPAYRHRALANLPMDDRSYQALMDHINATVEESHTYEAGRQRALCTRQRELVTETDVVSAMERLDQEVEVYRAKLLGRADAVLGVGGRRQLDAIIAQFRRGLSFERSNHAAHVAGLNLTVPELIERFCASPPGKSDGA